MTAVISFWLHTRSQRQHPCDARPLGPVGRTGRRTNQGSGYISLSRRAALSGAVGWEQQRNTRHMHDTYEEQTHIVVMFWTGSDCNGGRLFYARRVMMLDDHSIALRVCGDRSIIDTYSLSLPSMGVSQLVKREKEGNQRTETLGSIFQIAMVDRGKANNALLPPSEKKKRKSLRSDIRAFLLKADEPHHSLSLSLLSFTFSSFLPFCSHLRPTGKCS